MSGNKKRLKAIHWDIITDKELKRFEKLKDRSGVNSDAEACRWAFRQLELRIDQDDKDKEILREQLRKSLLEE